MVVSVRNWHLFGNLHPQNYVVVFTSQMDLKQPTILITGASGIVGSHLVLELLQQGHNIKLLVRDKEKTENYLNDLIQYYQINIIYHRFPSHDNQYSNNILLVSC